MLIIYAHPNKDGHCGYVLEEVKTRLDEKGEDYQVLDLYEMKYNPVMKPEEHYTSGHREIAQDTKKIQDLITKNDRILLIYPTWWNGTPAVLKGFFDRVLVSGFGFKYKGAIPHGLLKGKKAAVITTTGGPVWAEYLLLGNRSLKVVVKDTLGFCGIKAKGFMIGSAKRFTEKQKRKIEKKVVKILSYIA